MSFFFTFGNIHIKIINKTGKALAFDYALQKFFSSSQKNDAQIVILPSKKIQLASTLKKKKVIFNSGGIWELSKSGKNKLFWYDAALNIDKDDRLAIISKNYKLIKVYANEMSSNAFSYPLDQFLAITLSNLKKQLIIHSCAAIINGKGAIFVGNSGMGKTTLARLLSQEKNTLIINDDRSIIASNKKSNANYTLYSTPWHGTGHFCENISAPLTAIYFLRHGKNNRLSTCDPTQASLELFAKSFTAVWDRTATKNALYLASKVIKNIPCYNFYFTPNETAAKFITGLH